MSRTTDRTDGDAGGESAGGCAYLSLYDTGDGSLTKWANTLADDFETLVAESDVIKRRLDLGTYDATALFEREGVDEGTVSDRTASQLIKADEARQAAGLPAACPHESHGDEPYCEFHLDPERCAELGIEPADIRRALLNRIGDESEDGAGRGKCFAGGRFRELSFSYRTLESTSNRPIQLQYAHIEELNLDDAVIDERLLLDGGTIESCSAEDARFRRTVSFDRAALDCDSLSFDGSVFEERASFRAATVTATRLRFQDCSFERGCSFEDAEFELALGNTDPDVDPVRFNGTEFDGGLTCSDAAFSLRNASDMRRQAAVKFRGCRFGGQVSFDDCEFGSVSNDGGGSLEALLSGDGDGDSGDDVTWKVQFKDAEFQGGFRAIDAGVAGDLRMRGAEFRGDGSDFDDTTIEGDFVLTNAEFRGDGSSFDGVTVTGAFYLNSAEFSQGAVTFAGIRVEGRRMDCEEVSFGGNKLSFARATIEGEAAFKRLSFAGGEASFGRLTVRGALDLEGSVFDVSGGDVDFAGLTVEEELNLRQATFTGNGIDFSDATVGEARPSGTTVADCTGSVWRGGEVDFGGSEFGGSTDWELTTFGGDQVSFAGMAVEGDVTFHHAEFETTETDLSELTVSGETFDMSHARLGGKTVFNGAELWTEAVNLRRLRADGVVVEFRKVESGETLVDLSNATVTDGLFEIGPQDTVYGFEGATIGDIEIALGEGEGALLEHFVFKNTDFDGFDFSRDNIKQELNNTGWRIHTTHGDETASPRRLRDLLGRYYRLITEGPDEDGIDPNELETTYMRAKLGADQQGDPDAVSQFFQKELRFRRRAHGHRFWDRDRGQGRTTYEALRSQVRIGWDWLANTTLGLTVGYGERPGNVVATSLLIVLAFAFVYRAIDALPPGSNSFDYVTYSFQGFIQLVVGIQTTGSILVRFFTAVEGFLGAFVIALFVITLTRSIDR